MTISFAKSSRSSWIRCRLRARRHHIRIGKDLAVFSCDDYNEHYTPEPTSITNNPEDIAATFWEMFQTADRGEKVESRYTDLFIRTGMTVPIRKLSGDIPAAP